jgi:hypothetical protein
VRAFRLVIARTANNLPNARINLFFKEPHMATLSLFRGAITGRLGEFVGSKWKGINYLRLYAKPSNPRTPDQISVRLVFKYLSLFASALYTRGFLNLIPPARRMTERNSVFKVNRQMLTNKTFDPEELQVGKSNFKANLSDLISTYNNSSSDFTVGLAVSLPAEAEGLQLQIHSIVYNHETGTIICNTSEDLPFISTAQFVYSNNIPFQPAPEMVNLRLYVFISGLDGNNKKLLSTTINNSITYIA